MLKFTRNKVVTVHRDDHDTLVSHGLLDDDIYSLEIDVSMSISGLKILSIQGKWNRWTTPECPRAVPFLQEAAGIRVREEGFSDKIRKIVGRKACRHFANLLIECCHCLKEAALLAGWEDEKKKNKDLTMEEFISGETGAPPGAGAFAPVPPEKSTVQENGATDRGIRTGASGGMILDLHVHTSPASPCSSAPVGQLIEEAKRIGLDGICLTDHNFVWDPGKVEDIMEKHDFLVIRGNEITTDQGDMVVFGLERDVQGIIKLEELRQEVLKAGGFIIAAHPFRGFLTFGVGQLGLTPEKAKERPLFKWIDAVEVMNGKVTEEENSFASKVAAGLALPSTGGSDAHEVPEVGLYATHFSEPISSERTLIEALKKGNYWPVAYREMKGKEEK